LPAAACAIANFRCAVVLPDELVALAPATDRRYVIQSPDMSAAINYDGRVFRTRANSSGGDVGEETTFHYHQRGDVVWATYAGGSIHFGTLLARADSDGNLDMRYQHLLTDGTFKTGLCTSRPEWLPDGRLRVHERWRWTDGAEGGGVSLIEEISAPSVRDPTSPRGVPSAG
jgi:hypothetical protein